MKETENKTTLGTDDPPPILSPPLPKAHEGEAKCNKLGKFI